MSLPASRCTRESQDMVTSLLSCPVQGRVVLKAPEDYLCCLHTTDEAVRNLSGSAKRTEVTATEVYCHTHVCGAHPSMTPTGLQQHLRLRPPGTKEPRSPRTPRCSTGFWMIQPCRCLLITQCGCREPRTPQAASRFNNETVESSDSCGAPTAPPWAEWGEKKLHFSDAAGPRTWNSSQRPGRKSQIPQGLLLRPWANHLFSFKTPLFSFEERT